MNNPPTQKKFLAGPAENVTLLFKKFSTGATSFQKL